MQRPVQASRTLQDQTFECRAYANTYRNLARRQRIFHTVSGIINIVLGSSTTLVVLISHANLFAIISGAIIAFNSTMVKFIGSLDYFSMSEKAADDYDKLADRFQLAFVDQEDKDNELAIKMLEDLMKQKEKLTDKYTQPSTDLIRNEKKTLLKERNLLLSDV